MLYFGQRSGFLSTVAVIATLVGGAATAQSLRDARPPAEFPPASFTANQYVDSRGCVFVRAGIGGSTEWVPRVSRSRDQLCGFQPSRVAGATTVAPQANVPNPLDTQVAGLAPRPVTTPAQRPAPAATPTPAPVVRAPVSVAAPTPRLTLPTSTSNAINPLTGRPASATAARAPVQAASPSPRVITAPAATAAQPRVLTRAVACAGLTGIQTNLVSQRTGQPINCGGTQVASQVAAVTRPAVQPTAPSRVNREQACADTTRQYVSATTGLPVRCGPQTQRITDNNFARLRADLAAPQRPYSNPLDAAPGSTFASMINRPQAALSNQRPYSNPLDSAPGSTTFTPGVNTQVSAACGGATAGGLALRCGPQALSPSGGIRQATVSRARNTRTGRELLAEILGQDPPPYSNPTRTYALPAATVPDGYTHVWSDGRLNTQRGIPGSTQNGIRIGPQTQSPSGRTNTVRYATATRQQAVEQPRVSTRVAQQVATPQAEQISGHRYVQVATFDSRDQAQAAAQALRTRGLPMRIGVFNQNGREMRVVLAGPFSSDSQLQNALGTTRGAGYSGAYTRR